MRRKTHILKLGKGSGFFVKSTLKRLPQQGDTWEVDFRRLPRGMMQNETPYVGLVVVERGGSVPAAMEIEGKPSVNHLATLLGKAMRETSTGAAHRPRRIYVRGHRPWQELFPHLEELGIK